MSVVAFVPYLAIQMKGAGYVLSAVTRGGIPEWVGGALVYGVVLVYVLRSGVLGRRFHAGDSHEEVHHLVPVRPCVLQDCLGPRVHAHAPPSS